jgi:hypothetical protein
MIDVLVVRADVALDNARSRFWVTSTSRKRQPTKRVIGISAVPALPKDLTSS